MSLEKLLDYLEPKTFGKIHYVAVVFWILICVIFLAIFADMENSEPRFDFRCGAAKSQNIDLVRGICYEKYQEQYNKFALPVYGFVIMNFVLIIFVCVIYSQIVRPTVNRLSRSIRNGDPERQSRNQENALSTGYKLFIAYCCQLSTRLVLGVVFIILQTQLLYPLKFPSKFQCYLTNGTTQPRNSSDNAQHSTLHNCYNQRAVKTNSWMAAVLVVNGIFAAGILIEIVYIFFRACRERDFMQNSKFQTSHLNPSEESRQQEEREQNVIYIPHEIQQQERTEHEINISHLPSGPELLVNSPLEKFIQKTKKTKKIIIIVKSIPFDKKFEILGFSPEQVEEYVTKFTEEDKEAGDTVKRHVFLKRRRGSLYNATKVTPLRTDIRNESREKDIPLPRQIDFSKSRSMTISV